MFRPFDIASHYALQLSLMEIGLGSILHAFRIPFSGFFLSLNQCFILNRALLHPSSSFSSTPHFLPIAISNTAAIVKTLSPYGKKFTPMLAISMQGLLFNVGIVFFGKNLVGRCVGSILLSLWPIIQPALIYGIIYGSVFLSMGSYYDQMIVSKLLWFEYMPLRAIVVGYIFVHLFFTLCVCLLTSLLPAGILDSYDRYILSYHSGPKSLKQLSPSSKNTLLQKIRGAGRDLISPIFLLSLMLSGLFFYVTLHSLESFFFSFFRLIAMAFLTFFLIRNVSAEWCVRIFSKIYFLNKYTHYVEEVLEQIQGRIKTNP